MGNSWPDAKVEIGTVRAPEEALVVEATELGIEDGLIVISSSCDACEQQLRQDANRDGQQANVRHGASELVSRSMPIDGRRGQGKHAERDSTVVCTAGK